MKPTRLIAPLLLLLAVVIYFSCQKSASPGTGYKPEYVTASVSGRVVDNNNAPVEGAVIRAGAATTTTNVNGEFTISNASLDKNAGYIRAEKAGFFPGSRTIGVNTARAEQHGSKAVPSISISPNTETLAGTLPAISPAMCAIRRTVR